MQAKWIKALEKRHLPINIINKKKGGARLCAEEIIEILLKNETIENQGWMRRSDLVRQTKAHPVTFERILKELVGAHILDRHDVVIPYERSRPGKQKKDVYYRVALAFASMNKMSKDELIQEYLKLLDNFGKVSQKLFAAHVLLVRAGVKDPKIEIKNLLDDGLFQPVYEMKSISSPPFFSLPFASHRDRKIRDP